MLLRFRFSGVLAFTIIHLLTVAASTPVTWSGLVSSVDGAPTSGATIELRPTGKGTSTPISTTASPAGEFHFLNLPAGEYEVSVTLNTKTYRSPSHITIGSGALTTDLELSVSGIDGKVTVVQEATEPESSGGEHLSSGEVSSLPLNSRDFSKLLLLAAGTMTDTNGAANFTQQFAVNGQRGTATVFAIDAADTTDPEMGGATFSNFDVDAIQEV
jgi:hypothetical protein